MELNNRILVIDDDPEIQRSYRQILQPDVDAAIIDQGRALFGASANAPQAMDPDYELTIADNGDRGINAVKRSLPSERPFAAAFIDLNMPGLNGLATAKRIWQLDPRIRVAIVTALNCVKPENTVQLLGRKDVLFLNKPFTRDEIWHLARFMTHCYALERREAFHCDQLEQKVAARTRELEQSRQKLIRASQRMRRTLDSTINAMATMLEIKDPYTSGHQRRVSVLAVAIAAEMGLDTERVESIRMAGLLHDLGKISIPSEILSRPGKLNKPEMQIVELHSEFGHDILKEIDFPWPVAEIVLQHHERLDGSGYPRRLKDADILLEARIIAIADVVEAMASHRPYRAALGLTKALAEIKKGQGVIFDAKAVDACLRVFNDNGFQW